MIRTLQKQETRWASLASGFFVGCQGLIACKPGSHILNVFTDKNVGAGLARDGGCSGQDLLGPSPNLATADQPLQRVTQARRFVTNQQMPNTAFQLAHTLATQSSQVSFRQLRVIP